MQKVARGCWADMSGWAGRFSLECDDGEWYECYWLRLPSYGWHRLDYCRREAWCQFVLFWHGRDGLAWFWDEKAR